MQWHLQNLDSVLFNHIIDKIGAIHIPVTDIDDELAWEYIVIVEYSIKIATWGNNEWIRLNPKVKFVQYLEIEFAFQIKIFA